MLWHSLVDIGSIGHTLAHIRTVMHVLAHKFFPSGYQFRPSNIQLVETYRYRIYLRPRSPEQFSKNRFLFFHKLLGNTLRNNIDLVPKVGTTEKQVEKRGERCAPSDKSSRSSVNKNFKRLFLETSFFQLGVTRISKLLHLSTWTKRHFTLQMSLYGRN